MNHSLKLGDGACAQATTPPLDSVPSNWVLSFWVKTDNTLGPPVSYATDGGVELEIGCYADLTIALDGRAHRTGVDLADDRWHFVTLACRAATLVLSVDGFERPLSCADGAITLEPGGRLSVGWSSTLVAANRISPSQIRGGELRQVALWDADALTSDDGLMPRAIVGDEPELLALLSDASSAATGVSWSPSTTLVLNGTPAEYASIAGIESFPSDALSATMWVKVPEDTPSVNKGCMLSYMAQTPVDEFFLYNYKSVTLCVRNALWHTGVALDDGRWHFVAATWHAGSHAVALYVDGECVARKDDFAAGGPIRAGGTLTIGQEQDALGGAFHPSQSFQGAIRQVAIWDRALSDAEVADLAERDLDGTEPGIAIRVASDHPDVQLHGVDWAAGPAPRAGRSLTPALQDAAGALGVELPSTLPVLGWPTRPEWFNGDLTRTGARSHFAGKARCRLPGSMALGVDHVVHGMTVESSLDVADGAVYRLPLPEGTPFRGTFTAAMVEDFPAFWADVPDALKSAETLETATVTFGRPPSRRPYDALVDGLDVRSTARWEDVEALVDLDSTFDGLFAFAQPADGSTQVDISLGVAETGATWGVTLPVDAPWAGVTLNALHVRGGRLPGPAGAPVDDSAGVRFSFATGQGPLKFDGSLVQEDGAPIVYAWSDDTWQAPLGQVGITLHDLEARLDPDGTLSLCGAARLGSAGPTGRFDLTVGGARPDERVIRIVLDGSGGVFAIAGGLRPGWTPPAGPDYLHLDGGTIHLCSAATDVDGYSLPAGLMAEGALRIGGDERLQGTLRYERDPNGIERLTWLRPFAANRLAASDLVPVVDPTSGDVSLTGAGRLGEGGPTGAFTLDISRADPLHCAARIELSGPMAVFDLANALRSDWSRPAVTDSLWSTETRVTIAPVAVAVDGRTFAAGATAEGTLRYGGSETRQGTMSYVWDREGAGSLHWYDPLGIGGITVRNVAPVVEPASGDVSLSGEASLLRTGQTGGFALNLVSASPGAAVARLTLDGPCAVVTLAEALRQTEQPPTNMLTDVSIYLASRDGGALQGIPYPAGATIAAQARVGESLGGSVVWRLAEWAQGQPDEGL